MALASLNKTRSDDLRAWFVEHGQMSGWHHRVKGLSLPKPKKYTGLLETQRVLRHLNLRSIAVMGTAAGTV